MASIAANRNIWQKKNMKTNKQTKISSLESIMKEQQNEKKNATNDMVTISKDLRDLVDQGILTQNEALAMMQQNDTGPEMVQDEKNVIPMRTYRGYTVKYTVGTFVGSAVRSISIGGPGSAPPSRTTAMRSIPSIEALRKRSPSRIG